MEELTYFFEIGLSKEWVKPPQKELSRTLRTGGGRPAIMKTKDNEIRLDDLANGKYTVRKLTERECFRLMGVKDSDFDKIAKNQSQSKLYHLAGDSIVTTCLMGIFGQMFNVDWKEKIKEITE